MHADIGAPQVAAAMRAVAAGLLAGQSMLTDLDQAVGDGDLGVTATKLAEALAAAAADFAPADLGKAIGQVGMALNRAAPSTMGTLMATALMRAGAAVAGKAALDAEDLARMLAAADAGIQARGKAQPGDKTIIDALHPAGEAFTAALAQGAGLPAAAAAMLEAARAGRDRVTPLRNKVGRAGWLGERTEGKVDPGCGFAVVVLAALAGLSGPA